jgi:hypothetical protein
MQVAQELQAHVADLKFSIAKLRPYRFSKNVTVLFVVIAFVLGWVGGNFRGISDGSMIESEMNAYLLAASAEGRGDGRDYLSDYFFARAADRLVREQVASESRGFKDRLWEKSSVVYWIGKPKLEDQRRMVARVAEKRLKYLQSVSAATMRELAAAKREWLPANQAQNYGTTARDYSILLGRPISPEQLVFDAELRHNLGIVRTQQN